MGTPIPADFPLETAVSVRSNSPFDPMDANFGLADLDPLGEGAQVIPPIAAPIHPDPLPRHVGEPAHGGGRHRLMAGAFEHGLCSLGIDLRLVAERLEAGDAIFQRRIGEIGHPPLFALAIEAEWRRRALGVVPA